MVECYIASSHQRVFSQRLARWAAVRDRRKGLSWGPRRTVEFQTLESSVGHRSFGDTDSYVDRVLGLPSCTFV